MGDLSKLNDEECHAHGLQLGRELTIHRLRLVLEGLIEGHLVRRSEHPTQGDAMLGPDKHFSRAAEMLGCMEQAHKARSTPHPHPQVQME